MLGSQLSGVAAGILITIDALGQAKQILTNYLDTFLQQTQQSEAVSSYNPSLLIKLISSKTNRSLMT